MSRPTCIMLGSLFCLWSAGIENDRVRAGQTVVVVLDDSGSMDRRMPGGPRRIEAAREALTTVMRGLEHDTSVGVLALNSRVEDSEKANASTTDANWIVPIGSPDAARWQHLIARIKAKGGTPLGHAVRAAADELLRRRSLQPYETFRMLVVTDGEATDAPLLNSILPDLLSRGINLDVIGVDMKADHSLARLAHSYRRAGDQASLQQALSEVLGETAATDNTSQADFDLISGLSEETAVAIVQGLAAPRNDPLQEAGHAANASVASVDATTSSTATPPEAARASRQNSSGLRISLTLGGLCCIGTFGVIVFALFAIIVSALKNQTRS